MTADSAGYVQAPASLDLVVYLDAEDISSAVWVSDSPAISASGTPAGRTLGSCSSGSLLPFGETNKWVCRVSTSLLQPGHTYYWWLDFDRQDPGTPAPTSRVSGPFSFSLAQQVTPPPPVPAPPPVVKDPHAPVSTKTIKAAETLPSSTVFNGSRSVKHTTLTRLVYRTMKKLGYAAPARICLLEPHRLGLRSRGGGDRAHGGRLGAPGILAWPATSLAAPGARDLHATCRVCSRPSSRMPGGPGLSAR